MKRLLGLSLLFLLCSVAVFADIAPLKTPKPTPASKSKPVSMLMSIKMDPETKVATLSIPRAQLKELRAQIEQLEGETDDTTAALGSFSRTQTMISGAFLSLALVFGGLWFVRGGKAKSEPAKSLLILAMIGVIGSAGTFVYANVGPPMELRSITSKLFDKKAFGYWTSASGRVDVVVSDKQAIELSVPVPKNWPKDEQDTKDKE
ncbi:MAG: hypothetical protein JNL64_06035 [Blastocatellia bacterium]|nr:hypothetical protein [Blastocatellia bacterium]